MRIAHLLSLSIALLLSTPVLGDTALYEGLLSTDATRSGEFLRKNPEWDGRGVVIAVLDTGVDVGAQGLEQLPTGKPKVIIARDFSGQGTITLEKALPEESEQGLGLRDSKGILWLPEERYLSLIHI